MTRKPKHGRGGPLLLPPSPPPRNLLATAPKMLRGVQVHEKSRGALRRAEQMALGRMSVSVPDGDEVE